MTLRTGTLVASSAEYNCKIVSCGNASRYVAKDDNASERSVACTFCRSPFATKGRFK